MRVWNWEDTVIRENGEIRELECEALVDSGAMRTSFPSQLVQDLGLREMGRVRAVTADGARHEYRLVGLAGVEGQGRDWVGEVVELPTGGIPLLGAITLEAMGWHISPAERRLLPNPESPDMPQVLLMGISALDSIPD